MKSEKLTQREIWLAASKLSTVFRCNTGKAWVPGAGKPIYRDGDVLLPGGRPVALGLSMPNGDPLEGTADLIGWTTVTITPDMVGRQIAVFTAIECKAEKGGKKLESQINFQRIVTQAGGFSIFADNNSKAVSAIQHLIDHAGI